jgi:glc operon protein GlcG
MMVRRRANAAVILFCRNPASRMYTKRQDDDRRSTAEGACRGVFMHTSIALAFGATLMFAAEAAAQHPAPPASSPYNSPAGVWPPYGSPGVTLGQAKKLAEAAEAEARRNGWKMAIAVVSNEGSLIYFGRMEDTQFSSSDIAIRKAKTAAEFRRPTKEFQDAISATPPVLLALSAGPIAIEGGLPLLSNGKIIGAIGCSGGTPGQDEQVCKAVVDTIN